MEEGCALLRRGPWRGLTASCDVSTPFSKFKELVIHDLGRGVTWVTPRGLDFLQVQCLVCDWHHRGCFQLDRSSCVMSHTHAHAHTQTHMHPSVQDCYTLSIAAAGKQR